MAKNKKRPVDDDEDEAPVRRKRKRTTDEDDAPRRSKSSNSSSVVTLDFSKDTSEGRKKFRPGDYPFKVKSIKMGHSSQKHTPQCEIILVFGKGSKYAGDTIKDTVYITEKALWRIRAVFAAAGKPLPKKKMKIDFKDLVGADLWATVGEDEYEDNNGKSRIKSVIDEYLEEEPDEPDDDDEDEDEDDDEDDDLEDMDVDDDL